MVKKVFQKAEYIAQYLNDVRLKAYEGGSYVNLVHHHSARVRAKQNLASLD